MNSLNKKTIIYLDNASTTPLSDKAKKEMDNYWNLFYGNPSSLYSLGVKNKKTLTYCRKMIAECINADTDEIFFTSCGTESNNWALKGTAFKLKEKGNHIIVSAIEHHAILNTCEFLKKQGFEITYLPVNKFGEVEIPTLQNAIKKETILISIMMVNNEIGTIQNIKELCQIAHSKNILFHTDAVQAIGHIPVNVKDLDIDMLSCSGHKFNGPKGIGFLYIKKGIEIEPLLNGGQQENNMRAGTENIPLIVGMATALKEHIEMLTEQILYINNLRYSLIEQLKQNGIDFNINGSNNCVPGIISLSFKSIEGETVLHRLDLKGICVSTGSACDSKNTQLSHVLKAIHCDKEYAYGTIRISISHDNTLDEIISFVNELTKLISGNVSKKMNAKDITK